MAAQKDQPGEPCVPSEVFQKAARDMDTVGKRDSRASMNALMACKKRFGTNGTQIRVGATDKTSMEQVETIREASGFYEGETRNRGGPESVPSMADSPAEALFMETGFFRIRRASSNAFPDFVCGFE
jgi:hypothetical protein